MMPATGLNENFRDLPLAEMEATIARFEERVNEAQLANPPTKDLVKAAVRRAGAPRCPVRMKRLSLDVIVRYGDALADLFCEFPDDALFLQPYDIFLGYQPPERKDRVSPVEALMRAAEWTDEWGIRWGHAYGGVGATPVDCPIKDWSQLDEYLAGSIPDPRAPGRLDAAARLVEQHREAKYCVGIAHLALFERLHCLRGMENVFADLGTNEREVRRLLDALTGYLVEIIRQWGEMRADAMFLTDDWGSQTTLMISPGMWRSYFKPCYRIIFDEIHRCGMDIFFHSCGNVTAIVPDLIELGVDVLDPIQPGAMDQQEIARRIGGRISFSGAIDDQHLLGSRSPQEVKDTVRRVIDTLGTPFGNGLILAPANVITPEVPLENLRAMFEACHGV
jgi:uroporphyrinogen decarboxylase